MKKTLLLYFSTIILLFAQDTIQIHTCYGNAHELFVEGRLLDKEHTPIQTKDESWIKNLWYNINHLMNDEIKDTPIQLHLNDTTYHCKSDDEGYFEFHIHTLNDVLHNHQPIKLFLPEHNLTNSCSLQVLPNIQEVGIISDFDDTLIISDVNYKLSLLNNFLLKNYKQREVVKGMSQRFKEILSTNPINTSSALFIITGSPKQLQEGIHNFLDFHHFPKRVLIMKKMHGKNADALFNQVDYKTAKIENLIRLYPKVKWVLFGDSGEQDQEIYEAIAKKHPSKIKAIFIRNVQSGEIRKITLRAEEVQ